MALTKVINDLADLNQSDSTNALKGCAGTTAQQPASSSSIEYLIVGGGGAGGWSGGGGGAGGLLTGTTTVYHGKPTVLTIGEGGTGIVATTSVYYLGNGNDSGFNGIRAIGGGTGGSWSGGSASDGFDGGSGGGAGSNGLTQTGGNGTTGQGLEGGDNYTASAGWGGGGGGGAGTSVGNTDGAGLNGAASTGGNGGSGRDMQSFISSANANLAQIGDVSGSNVWFSGGGGGGIQDQSPVSVTGGTGGNGGGANGSGNADTPTAAQSNTGGGGGGGGQVKISGTWTEGSGGDGGSGVSVLKYDNTVVTGYTLNSEDTYTVNWPADKYGVAYWPLNLNAKDVGGNYDGTATDVTYVTGKFNQAASFNGSSSYIDTTFFWPSISTVSVSLWFNVTTSTPRWTMFGDYDSLGADISGRLSLTIDSSNNFEVNTANGSSSDTWATISASPYFNGAWHHLVVTANGTALKLYVDGVLLGSDTSTVSIGTAGAQSVVFGRAGDYNGNYMNGQLEQCRIYTSELSLTDVQDIYNNSKPGSLSPLKTSSDLTYNVCDYPSSAGAQGLFIFDGDITDTCSNITFTAATNGTLVSSYGTGKFASQSALWNGTNSSSGNTMETSYAWLSNGGAFTVSLWVKYEEIANPVYQSMLMSNTTSWTTYGGIILHTYGASNPSYPNTVMFSFASSTGLGSPTWRIWRDIPGGWANNWVHLAMSQNSAGLKKAYINGVKVGEDSSAVTTIGEHDLTFGGYNGVYTNDRFKGEMSNLRIYNQSLSDQHVYDLWQKENSIQTHFTSGSTDTLVFKEGSGEITFKNDTPPGAEIGMLRYNSTLGQMEHFNSGGWKDFTNCTTFVCNYPITAAALYQLSNNANDTCGNYDGTANNITYGTGKFNQAAYLDGSSTSVYLGFGSGGIQATSAVDNSFSISWWMNSTDTGVNALMNTYGSGAGAYGFTIEMGSGTAGLLKLFTYYGGGQTITLGTTAINDGNWHHIVAVKDAGSTMKLYIDTVEDVSVSISSGAQVGNELVFGNYPYPHAGYEYVGLIEQVRTYTSVLTETQISELYNEVYCP